MNPVMSLSLPEPHPEDPIASPFYTHPYGGIARDIWVSREGFARFFGHSVEYIDSCEVGMKLFDDFHTGMKETYGYKIKNYNTGRIEYRITIIDNSFRTRTKFHQQEMKKLVKKFEQLRVVAELPIRSFNALSHPQN